MLDGKVVIITGSTRGIGKSIAELFLKNKARVVICGTKKDLVDEVIKEFLNKGFLSENMLGVCVNVTSDYEVENLVSEVISKWGKIDVLINNAGITSNVSLLDSNIDDFLNMYDVNVFGTVRTIKSVIKYMKEYGGVIINTSSMVGINGGINQSAYASSKGAINTLTISLAKELGKYNIRVNAVAPGVVLTDMMKSNVSEEVKNMLINMTPLKRMADPSDIAGAYLYLASDESKFTTGTIIKVDGGLMM